MKRLTAWVAGAAVIGAGVLVPLQAQAYPAGDIFRVEQTNTSVRAGYTLKLSAASVARNCKVKFYQDVNKSLAGSRYLGTRVAGRYGTTKSVKANTTRTGSFYIIAKVVECPAMAKEPRVAYTKFRVVPRR